MEALRNGVHAGSAYLLIAISARAGARTGRWTSVDGQSLVGRVDQHWPDVRRALLGAQLSVASSVGAVRSTRRGPAVRDLRILDELLFRRRHCRGRRRDDCRLARAHAGKAGILRIPLRYRFGYAVREQAS